jgi:molybdopterin-guanine dinucleotide biosynthesis protein A
MQNTHNEKYPDVTGVILAGGKSRRMGTDKARLKLSGQSLFERSLELLQSFFATIIIAGDRPDLARPGIPAIPDLYPGSALGGLHTGLISAKTDWIFVVPCDMPYPDPLIIETLLQYRQAVEAVIPRTSAGYEPVFALYHKNCLPQMEAMLQQDQFRIYDFYQRIPIRYLEPPDLPDGWQRSLININTPEQLTKIEKENR